MTTEPMPDRRPLKSRQWPVVQRMARVLAAGRVTPNAISVAGMVAGVLGGACLAATAWAPAAPLDWGVRLLCVAAVLCIQFRLLCNLLDGLVAVEGLMRSPVGEVYNEVPDRVSDAATLIGAGYAIASSPALGWGAAVVALFVAYVRAVGKGCGLGYDFAGPMAKQHRMAVMSVACLVAAAAPRVSLPAPGRGDDARWGVFAWALVAIIVGGVITALRRLGRLGRALRERAA
jgi:phosphatidylglycerophosphate synthase